jgi:hypothetical protein
MMAIQMKECCVDCDAYTERAGKHDDSLYLDDGSGPYCLPCYDHHRVEELEASCTSFRSLLDREKLAKVARDCSNIGAFEALVIADALIKYLTE